MLSSHERWRGRAEGCWKRVREGNVDAAGVGGSAGWEGWEATVQPVVVACWYKSPPPPPTAISSFPTSSDTPPTTTPTPTASCSDSPSCPLLSPSPSPFRPVLPPPTTPRFSSLFSPRFRANFCLSNVGETMKVPLITDILCFGSKMTNESNPSPLHPLLLPAPLR